MSTAVLDTATTTTDISERDGMNAWRLLLESLQQNDRVAGNAIRRELGISVDGFDADRDLVRQAERHMGDIVGGDAAESDTKRAEQAINGMRTRHLQELEAVRRGQAAELAKATAALADANRRLDAAKWGATRLEALRRKRPQLFSRDGMGFIDAEKQVTR